MDWDKLPDASGDGRGATPTIDPTLQGIKQGASHTFGPFASKASAKASMVAYGKRQAASGLTFEGPRGSGTEFYFRATRA